jgi:hypothetical protein
MSFANAALRRINSRRSDKRRRVPDIYIIIIHGELTKVERQILEHSIGVPKRPKKFKQESVDCRNHNLPTQLVQDLAFHGIDFRLTVTKTMKQAGEVINFLVFC